MTIPVADERAGDLYTLLVEYPDGMTSKEIKQITEWSDTQFSEAVQALRDIFSDTGDSITITAEPRGQGEPWMYILRDGNLAADEDKSRWAGIMIRHAERRIKTIKHVLATAVKATDGRTVLGKKARIYHLHLDRAQQEINLLTNEDGLIQ